MLRRRTFESGAALLGRIGRRGRIVAGLGLLAALGLVIAWAGGEREPTAASPSALNAVAAKNEDAMVTEAARLKARSERAARATDARRRQDEAAAGDAQP